MPDALFTDPRLAALYDTLDGERSDLRAYVDIVRDLHARSVLDVGCGTGTFALVLSSLGFEVTGVDPAAASLDVARAKPGAGAVSWIEAAATELPPIAVDVITMTGNVAQVFVDDDEWAAVLRAAHDALAPGGHLVFEVRRPEREAWLEWSPELTRTTVEAAGVGPVTSWVEVTQVSLPLVSFRWTFVLGESAEVVVSDSTLRFRSRAEIEASLDAAGFAVSDVRDAPDRPGREHVFVAVAH
ncbi:MAG: class I SAM-dependent methyltransferase [Actinobacteria bacterium]|nr:class I SAM-dependent methyltransferase [Actinomycetota bacterium]